MIKITFKPKQITKALLSVLPDRAQEVLTNRYGLGKNVENMTLEAIGKKYGITRERVRQIENHAISSIKKSEQFKKESQIFDELEALINSLGGVIPEDEFLQDISKDGVTQNQIHFLLIVGEAFTRQK